MVKRNAIKYHSHNFKVMVVRIWLMVLTETIISCAPAYYTPHIVQSSNTKKPDWVLNQPYSTSSYIYVVGFCMNKAMIQDGIDCAVKNAFSKILLGYFGVQMNLQYTGIQSENDKIELRSNGYLIGAKQRGIYWEQILTRYPDQQVTEKYNTWVLLQVSRNDIETSLEENKALRTQIVKTIKSSITYANQIVKEGFIISALRILFSAKRELNSLLRVNEKELYEAQLHSAISNIISGLNISSATSDVYISPTLSTHHSIITLWVRYKTSPAINVPIFLQTKNNEISFLNNPIYTNNNGFASIKIISINNSADIHAVVDLQQFNRKHYPDISTNIALHLLCPQVGGFNNAGFLPYPVESAGAIAFNNKIYVIGGLHSNNHATNKVNILGFDALGYMQHVQNGNSLNTARSSPVVLLNKNIIYVLSGGNGKNVLSSVEFSSINPDGTIQPWKFTSSLNQARFAAGGTIYDGYIYIIGGLSSKMEALRSVEFARINSDGSISKWFKTSPLNIGSASIGVFAYRGYLYVLGGWNHNTLSVVERASINKDGRIGDWVYLPALNKPISAMSLTLYDAWLFLVGGRSGNQRLRDAEFTNIMTDGSFGRWQTANSLPNYRAGSTAITLGNHLYIIGGWNGKHIYSTVLFTAIK